MMRSANCTAGNECLSPRTRVSIEQVLGVLEVTGHENAGDDAKHPFTTFGHLEMVALSPCIRPHDFPLAPQRHRELPVSILGMPVNRIRASLTDESA
jgi:hypothetical protein